MRLSVWRCAVLLVGDALAPGHGAARVIGLLNGDVGHEAIGRSAMPVLLVRLEEDSVPRPDHVDLTTSPLAEPDALGHVDRLPEGMRVPGGSSAGREVDAGRGDPRGLRWRGNG